MKSIEEKETPYEFGEKLLKKYGWKEGFYLTHSITYQVFN